MSFASLLDHTVTLVRQVGATEDDYGHAETVATDMDTLAASIQPKSARERAQFSQAGIPVSDHTIFLFPVDIRTGDYLRHTAADCAKPAGVDLPDGRYEVTAVPDAAGRGHHLEVDARLISERAIE